jgi:hypothetical protein
VFNREALHQRGPHALDKIIEVRTFRLLWHGLTDTCPMQVRASHDQRVRRPASRLRSGAGLPQYMLNRSR